MTLNTEQVRDVLARAEEIQQQRAYTPSEQEIDEVLAAAEEAGLDRETVLQALRERISTLGEPPKIGDRLFAKSSDGRYYMATVLELKEGAVLVRYGQGGEHFVSNKDVRPCSFRPGERVVCPWPDWGWWTCKVLAFDATADTIKVTDGWGSEQVFAVADVRMAEERQPSKIKGRVMGWILVSVISGGAIGSLITWLFMR